MDQVSEPGRTDAADSRPQLLWLILTLAFAVGYFLALRRASFGPLRLVVNDFAGVQWLAARQVYVDLRTLGDLNYPWGYPALLRVMRPFSGDFVAAAKTLQAAMAASSLVLVYLLARRVAAAPGWAAFAAAVALAMSRPFVSVGTSAMSDMTAVALSLTALLVLAVGLRRSRLCVIAAGAILGVAYALRYHYLVLPPLLAVAIAVFQGGRLVRRLWTVGWLLLGFVAVAWTVWLVNTVNFGSPLASLSTWIAYHVIRRDYHLFDPALYADYHPPLLSLLWREPQNIMIAVGRSLGILAGQSVLIWSAALGLASAVLIGRQERGRDGSPAGRILAAAAIGYAAAISLTRYTDRAFLLVLCLMALLLARGLAGVRRSLRAVGVGWSTAGLSGAALAYALAAASSLYDFAEDYRARGSVSDTVCRALRVMPDYAPERVLTYDSGIAVIPEGDQGNLFYWLNGWLNFNARYVAERPMPPFGDYEAMLDFIQRHGIHYVVVPRELAAPGTPSVPQTAERLVEHFAAAYENPSHVVLDARRARGPL